MAATALLTVLTAPTAPRAQMAGAQAASPDAGFASALDAAGGGAAWPAALLDTPAPARVPPGSPGAAKAVPAGAVAPVRMAGGKGTPGIAWQAHLLPVFPQSSGPVQVPVSFVFRPQEIGATAGENSSAVAWDAAGASISVAPSMLRRTVPGPATAMARQSAAEPARRTLVGEGQALPAMPPVAPEPLVREPLVPESRRHEAAGAQIDEARAGQLTPGAPTLSAPAWNGPAAGALALSAPGSPTPAAPTPAAPTPFRGFDPTIQHADPKLGGAGSPRSEHIMPQRGLQVGASVRAAGPQQEPAETRPRPPSQVAQPLPAEVAAGGPEPARQAGRPVVPDHAVSGENLTIGALVAGQADAPLPAASTGDAATLVASAPPVVGAGAPDGAIGTLAPSEASGPVRPVGKTVSVSRPATAPAAGGHVITDRGTDPGDYPPSVAAPADGKEAAHAAEPGAEPGKPTGISGGLAGHGRSWAGGDSKVGHSAAIVAPLAEAGAAEAVTRQAGAQQGGFGALGQGGAAISAAPAASIIVAGSASGPGQEAASAARQQQPAAPADQLGQAVAGLHLGGGAGGHISIKLNPQELGGVEIQLRRSQDGGATLNLAVERPETLRALQADLSHLHQALDRAGLPAEQRSVTMHLAAADGGPAASGGGFGTAGQGGSSSAGHQRPGQQSARQAGPVPAASASEPEAAASFWQPSGFDITA